MDQQKHTMSSEGLSFPVILITLIVVLVSAVIFLLYQRRKGSKRGVLLTGLSDTGKTLLFCQLVHGKYVETQTSMRENIGDFVTNKGMLRIIDIPGYERLRNKFLDQYISMARGVMYVVDSTTIQKDIRSAAEYLYNILLDGSISNLLVVCNKQDLPLARHGTVIKSMLEKELNMLRITKANQLESVDEKSTKTAILGKEGKDFAFANLAAKVEFVEASALSDSDNVELKNWLSNLC